MFLFLSIDVFTDASNTFTGLLLQYSIMNSVFDLNPEAILVDDTYKLNNFRMPLYLLMSKSLKKRLT